jgi:DAK2 domain fusion protein YloV
MDPSALPVDQHPDALDVGVEAALGAPVGVAHSHAERRLLAAYLAHRCHKERKVSIRGMESVREPMERLGAAEMVAVVRSYRDALRSHQEAINRLNVFPVPDGDTGTNMALTVESVVEEIGRRDGQIAADSMVAVADAVGYGSLMGARGNSGVILSQILRGLTEALRASEEVDTATLVSGLGLAASSAYQAVQNPVEGTMLTVVRAAAESAASAGRGARLVDALDAARTGAAKALERTPELLPVLKEAGVVDAGGAGLVLLIDAFLHVVDGRPLPEPPTSGPGGAGAAAPALSPTGARAQASRPEGPRYEVMYLLEAADETVPALREVLAGLGDSVVVVGGDGLWNCHVHTDDIGAAVEAALGVGRPRRIRVSDLLEQVEEERWVREATAVPEAEAAEDHVRCAVVVVCNGDGIRRIFGSLGVRHYVEGGQSMNPSTAELVAAVEAANCDEAVILPNNRNVVAVAEQAALQSSKPVKVVPTSCIQEGFAALLDYDPEGSAGDNAERMATAASHIVAGEVTRAIRASSCPAGPIAEGDFLGLSRNAIEVVATSASGASCALLERLIDADHHEMVTVFTGEGSTAGETRRITEWLAERYPEVEVEVHAGGQPLYPYLFSIE